MKNGGKYKSVAFIILVSVCVCIYIYISIYPFWRPIHRQVAVVRHPQVTSRQSTAPVRELMSEVCVQPSQPAAVGHPQTLRRNISLPDDCSEWCFKDRFSDHHELWQLIQFSLFSGDIFITYSVDTAAELMPFVNFLINQGFRPAVRMPHFCLFTLSIHKIIVCFVYNRYLSFFRLIYLKTELDKWTSTNGWTVI